MLVNVCKCYHIVFPIAAIYCKAGVLISLDKELSHATLDDLYQRGHVKDVVKTVPHLSSVQSWKEDIELYVITCTLVLLSLYCGLYIHVYVS